LQPFFFDFFLPHFPALADLDQIEHLEDAQILLPAQFKEHFHLLFHNVVHVLSFVRDLLKSTPRLHSSRWPVLLLPVRSPQLPLTRRTPFSICFGHPLVCRSPRRKIIPAHGVFFFWVLHGIVKKRGPETVLDDVQTGSPPTLVRCGQRSLAQGRRR